VPPPVLLGVKCSIQGGWGWTCGGMTSFKGVRGKVFLSLGLGRVWRIVFALVKGSAEGQESIPQGLKPTSFEAL